MVEPGAADPAVVEAPEVLEPMVLAAEVVLPISEPGVKEVPELSL